MVSNPKARLLDQVREVLRLERDSLRTGEAYLQSNQRTIFSHDTRNPKRMGAEIRMFVKSGAVLHGIYFKVQRTTAPRLPRKRRLPRGAAPIRNLAWS